MTLNRKPNPVLSNNVLDMFSMKGKVTIITGASGGIATEVAIGLAQAGGDLALWYHNSDAAVELAKKLSSEYGVQAKAYQVDVKSWEQVESTVNEVVKDFGHLDVMIANAGIPAKAGGLDQPLKDWHDVIDTDLSGAYYCARASAAVFKIQGKGNIIFTASMSAHIVNLPQHQGCYNAAKAGVLHLAKSLAVEFVDFCRVNSVSPGYIDTAISGDCPHEMKNQWYSKIPMERDADPREMKGIYLYLASDASTYATGADFIVDGGYCAP